MNKNGRLTFYSGFETCFTPSSQIMLFAILTKGSEVKCVVYWRRVHNRVVCQSGVCNVPAVEAKRVRVSIGSMGQHRSVWCPQRTCRVKAVGAKGSGSGDGSQTPRAWKSEQHSTARLTCMSKAATSLHAVCCIFLALIHVPSKDGVCSRVFRG